MKMGAEMRIGLYQFPGSGDMGQNYKTIEKAVSQAASHKVRFLAFHECALTGYPPLEVPSVSEVDYAAAMKYKECLRKLSIEHSMYIAAGSIEKEEDRYYNSMLLFSPEGRADIYGKRASGDGTEIILSRAARWEFMKWMESVWESVFALKSVSRNSSGNCTGKTRNSAWYPFAIYHRQRIKNAMS